MNIPELKKIYTEEAVPALMKSQGYGNVHQVPKIEKVVLNSSFGVELDKNGIEELRKDMASLSGQAPVVIKARVSVSNFKLREGMPVGIKVTLRGTQMWEFLLRLIAIALPNIRDFRGSLRSLMVGATILWELPITAFFPKSTSSANG